MKAIGIRDLHVGFEIYQGYVDVLNIKELCIEEGESYGLVGESGAGKTVLALALHGLLKQPPAVVTASRLTVGDSDLLTMTPRDFQRYRGKKIAMIFQDPMSALDPVFSVRTVLTDVIRRHTEMDRNEAVERAREYMSLVDLPDPETILGKYPHELSGGQRQRVVIALALACGSDLLVADEPTRNLDVTVQASILRTMDRLRRELGVTLLFIGNNLALVSAMCERVGILLKGRIVETGTARDVVLNAAHPYTHALLRAVPKKGEALHAEEIESDVRSRTASECVYSDRCPLENSECKWEADADLLRISDTHFVACPLAIQRPATDALDEAGLHAPPAVSGNSHAGDFGMEAKR